MVEVIISVGSNKGDREKNIINSIKKMEEQIYIEKISFFIETTPAENAEGGKFLNGAIAGKTLLDPENLFYFLKGIEKKMGRKFPHKKGDAREIDLDIIFYGEVIIKKSYLKIPHPRYKNRDFVLIPLLEIAPDFVDPFEKKSIKEIYEKKDKNENIQANCRNKGRDKGS